MINRFRIDFPQVGRRLRILSQERAEKSVIAIVGGGLTQPDLR